MKPRVLLVQLPIPPLSLEGSSGNGPLAAGALALRAHRLGLGASHEIGIFPPRLADGLGDRALVEEILAREPAVVGFTCYLWNVARTLWVAERLKERRPALVIVLGGPEITRDNAWVLGREAVDLAAFGEGEQTFADLLARRAAGADLAGTPGLWYRGLDPAAVPNRDPLPSLDLVTSPYLEGLLDLRTDGILALETIRGCVFSCAFCYYPKSYDKLYYLSEDLIRKSLRHARECGIREVYLLDPTLNQRRDFARFLEILAEENPDRSLDFHAELRAEGVKPEHARLMGAANFVEVEVGLQSTDAVAQELMDRRNNLPAFERGVRALREEGVRVKTDLIVGLPGDTEDSVRRSFHWVADADLFDVIQVFQLAILPGTSFRANAARLGLVHQDRPPYYVLRTETLELDTILELVDEAEEIFDTNFDPLPEPVLEAPAGAAAPNALVVDLDHDPDPRLPERSASAFSLRLRARDHFARLETSTRLVREFAAREPYSTLQVILEAGDEFPLDVLDALTAAARREEELYLDRVHAFLPGAARASLRLVTLTTEEAAARIAPDWLEAAGELCDLVIAPTASR
ncbi:MAG: radical SAM protein [Planctomycetota bacterium]